MAAPRRFFSRFSLKRAIQRAHAAITSDPAADAQLYRDLTQGFRSRLDLATPTIRSGASDAVTAAVARLQLSNGRHFRLLRLLREAETHVPSGERALLLGTATTAAAPPRQRPAAAAAGSVSSLLPPAVWETAPTEEWNPSGGFPDLYTALCHVPTASPADFALAIQLVGDHAGADAALRIYSLYLRRVGDSLPAGDPTAVEPASTIIAVLCAARRTDDADRLLRTLAPRALTWLAAAREEDGGVPRGALRAMHLAVFSLHLTAMRGFREQDELGLAARVYRDLRGSLMPDLYLPFEARPAAWSRTHPNAAATPVPFGPVPARDQSSLIMHLAATLDAASAAALWRARGTRRGFEFKPNRAAYSALWSLFAGAGDKFADLSLDVLRAMVAAEFAPQVSAVISVLDDLFTRTLELADSHPASALALLDSDPPAAARALARGLATMHALLAANAVPPRLVESNWATVFRAVRAVQAPAPGSHVSAPPRYELGEWVPRTVMASRADPLRALHQQQQDGEPMAYADHVVNLYAAYLAAQADAGPSAQVGGAAVDALVVLDGGLRPVLDRWLSEREADRLAKWIDERRRARSAADARVEEVGMVGFSLS
ncbi:hypothetical protein H9P43_006354 [Blastocladiella emersonii ATCC 22665]|nr:hypothetical protein H9P43_006354 [Blastocladiella emersonii ATCC 22665]